MLHAQYPAALINPRSQQVPRMYLLSYCPYYHEDCNSLVDQPLRRRVCRLRRQMRAMPDELHVHREGVCGGGSEYPSTLIGRKNSLTLQASGQDPRPLTCMELRY